MVTEVTKKSILSENGTMREKIIVDIPQSDMVFFKFFADKLGWQFKSKQTLWDEYLENSPENVDLSEDEIMEETRAIRYYNLIFYLINKQNT